MRAHVLGLTLALMSAGCSASSPANGELGADASVEPDAADAGSVSCTDAPSLESLCCTNTNILYAACPRDFAAFAAICGDNPDLRLTLSPTPCAGLVFANVSGTDTVFVFAFDATTGGLRAVLYGGNSPYTCSGAADPSVVIPWTCLNDEVPRGNLCSVGNEPSDGGFVSFCSTTSGGDPACPTYNNGQCPYPTSCVGGHCTYADAVDGGAEGD